MDSVLLTKIVSLIIYPLGFACVLMVFGGVMYLLQRRHLALGSWVLCVGILLLASNPMFARQIAYSLEQQFPQKALVDVPRVDAVIVLGGGLRLPLPPAQHTQVTSGSDRYWYAVRLYKANKADKIILSGGNVFRQQGFAGEANYAAELLIQWGVSPDDIIVEEGSRTTAQNAQHTEHFLAQHNIESALLVTSALHMPRSYGLFKELPVEVIPASADVLIQQRKHPAILNWLPSAPALLLTTVSLHEYYGMWANRWLF